MSDTRDMFPSGPFPEQTNDPPSPRVVALVMAAGRARRFGTDKRRARLPDGRSLLAATLALAQDSFSSVYVAIRDDDAPQALAIPPRVSILRTAHADEGLGSSLADAFLALETAVTCDVTAAAVLLGDMPWVAPATCRQLIMHADSARIVRPRHDGRPGHPVLFGRALWADMPLIRGQSGARELLRRHPAACRTLEVADAGIHRDVDRPADLAGYGDTRNGPWP
ncbi:nucleotidyltransferase family protein [Halomonas sp. WWR20]